MSRSLRADLSRRFSRLATKAGNLAGDDLDVQYFGFECYALAYRLSVPSTALHILRMHLDSASDFYGQLPLSLQSQFVDFLSIRSVALALFDRIAIDLLRRRELKRPRKVWHRHDLG